MISVRGIKYQYKGSEQPALDGIELDIEDGQLFGLLGPNGAGKTTLISLLTGLRKADAGSIVYHDRDINQHRTELQKCIAWVPQEYAFYPSMTVRENLRFFAGVLGLGGAAQKQRIDDVTRVTGLENAESKRAVQFSGGMKRRLNVAISLLGQPQYLFLDEPTVGIDPQSRHFILESIRKINQDGTTVIYSSHYMEEVEALCDQIAIVDHGKILTTGSLVELLGQGQSQPGSGDSLSLSLVNPLSEDVALTDGFSLTEDRLQIVANTLDAGAMAEQMQTLARAGVQLSRVNSGSNNLEQLFLRLTQRSLRD